MILSSRILSQTPYHAALLVAAGIAAIVANASTSSCDGEANPGHKVKHQDLKNQDAVAWARDSSSKFTSVLQRFSVMDLPFT